MADLTGGAPAVDGAERGGSPRPTDAVASPISHQPRPRARKTRALSRKLSASTIRRCRLQSLYPRGFLNDVPRDRAVRRSLNSSTRSAGRFGRRFGRSPAATQKDPISNGCRRKSGFSGCLTRLAESPSAPRTTLSPHPRPTPTGVALFCSIRPKSVSFIWPTSCLSSCWPASLPNSPDRLSEEEICARRWVRAEPGVAALTVASPYQPVPLRPSASASPLSSWRAERGLLIAVAFSRPFWRRWASIASTFGW